LKLGKISEELLNDGIDVRIHTRGLSMFPTIHTGDRITISAEKEPTVGDLIVFKTYGWMTCHRLVRIFEKEGRKYYQTRGDSLFSQDEPITADQILGKVKKVERRHVSIARKILILTHPILKFGRLNALAIAFFIRLKAVFQQPRSH